MKKDVLLKVHWPWVKGNWEWSETPKAMKKGNVKILWVGNVSMGFWKSQVIQKSQVTSRRRTNIMHLSVNSAYYLRIERHQMYKTIHFILLHFWITKLQYYSLITIFLSATYTTASSVSRETCTRTEGHLGM